MPKVNLLGQEFKRTLLEIDAALKSDRVSKIYRIVNEKGIIRLKVFSTFGYSSVIGYCDDAVDLDVTIHFTSLAKFIAPLDETVELIASEEYVTFRGISWTHRVQKAVGSVIEFDVNATDIIECDIRKMYSCLAVHSKLRDLRKDNPTSCNIIVQDNHVWSIFPSAVIFSDCSCTKAFQLDPLLQKFLIEYAKRGGETILLNEGEYFVLRCEMSECVFSSQEVLDNELMSLKKAVKPVTTVATRALRDIILNFPKTRITLNFNNGQCEITSFGGEFQLSQTMPCPEGIMAEYDFRQEYLLNILFILGDTVQISETSNLVLFSDGSTEAWLPFEGIGG